MEVIPPFYWKRWDNSSILHVCGGDPKLFPLAHPQHVYSPRMWRWSLSYCCPPCNAKVFSTYVEVILEFMGNVDFLASILHVCGGDPWEVQEKWSWLLYSPRMWRWSWLNHCSSYLVLVFSTYVEVILKPYAKFPQTMRILHVCGGDPSWWVDMWFFVKYSPRMWRWSLRGIDQKETITVFSTHVESVTVLERTDK